MKTGNGRRRKLNRLAKARALRARCQLWQREQEWQKREQELMEVMLWTMPDVPFTAYAIDHTLKLMEKAENHA
jgi:hypothetical protein